MKQLFAEQLTQHLQQHPLPPVLLLFGEELLLRQDALALLRKHLKQQFGDELERQSLQQQADFDWQQLHDSGQSMSLFSQFTLLELTLPENKPGRDGSDALTAYAKSPPAEQLLVVIGDKLKKEQQNSRWFKALSQQGWLVRTPTPDKSRLPRFIHQRAQQHGLQLTADATELLALWFEGNLPSLDQELQKWALIHSDQALNADAVKQAMRDVSHFDAFALQDSLLRNDWSETAHRLNRLFAEDVDRHQLLWVVQREVQVLSQLKTALTQQLDANSIYRQNMIWSSQQQAYQSRAQQLAAESLQQAQQLLQRLELALKNDSGENADILFTHCVALICVGPHQGYLPQQLQAMA